MDILEQYEKENPQTSSYQASQWGPSDEYGWPTRFVMRISRGRIQNERQANIVLIIAMIIMIIISLFLVFGKGWSTTADQMGIDQMIKLHPEMRR